MATPLPWPNRAAGLAERFFGGEYTEWVKYFHDINDRAAAAATLIQLGRRSGFPWNRANIQGYIDGSMEATVPAVRAALPESVQALLPKKPFGDPSEEEEVPQARTTETKDSSGTGTVLMAPQRKRRATTLGAFGVRQINRRPARIRDVNVGRPMYRVSFNIGHNNSRVIFHPFLPEASFFDLWPSGVPLGTPLAACTTVGWACDQTTHTAANHRVAVDALQIVNDTQHHLCTTNIGAAMPTPDPMHTAYELTEDDWEAGDTPRVYIPEVSIRGFIQPGSEHPYTVRIMAIQILQPLEDTIEYRKQYTIKPPAVNGTKPYYGWHVADFFENPDRTQNTRFNGINNYLNINAHMRPSCNMSDYIPAIGPVYDEYPPGPKLRFKVLCDQTLCLPKASAENIQTDVPFEMKYKLGVVTLNPVDVGTDSMLDTRNKYRLDGPGRVIFNMFYESYGDGWDESSAGTFPTDHVTLLPSWYGVFKMKYKVLDD